MITGQVKAAFQQILNFVETRHPQAKKINLDTRPYSLLKSIIHEFVS